MINVYPVETLGRANYGWLNAKYHFSFADYRNGRRVNFGKLRVINDDTVKAGSGFDMHKHEDMEIITFVRKGAITHKDSRGNEGRTEAGNVQVMSAGTGIYHSEFNMESEDTTLFQIWIYPREKGVEPRWDAAKFSDRMAGETLPLLVSGRKEDEGKGALYIHQDASIVGGRVKAGQTVTQPIIDQAYMLISDGEIEILGEQLRKGDGLEITDQKSVTFKALQDSEIIMIDVPA
ncbi:MAG: pirin family protein [Alphaproteobacteria bacterium]|nr:pirin family protein [Alphaproteobacteria bacterium]